MKKILVLTIMMGLLLTAGCGKEEEEVAEAPKEPILIGLLSDLSGGTADVGVPYAEGVKAAGEYINANGGIDGRQVKLLQVDYAYNVQQALAAYKKFKNQGIVALQGWGTGDTEALTQFVAKDEIPTFSASYSAHLTDPKIAPYNFFTATDYSTQARAGLKYIMESWNGEGAPRLALVYPDHPYGLSPIKAIKEYAQELGFELVGEEIVGLSAMDAATQLLSLQKKEPDFVWVGGTTQSTAVVMKDAQKLGMDVVFLTNIWGTDENIFKLAGDVADKHLSLQTSVVYGQDVPGMEFIEELTDGEPQVVHYIRGFVSMLTMAEGLSMAAAQGELTGPNIKAALETMRDYDPMGLAPPISFFPDDHRPNMTAIIFRLQDGEMVFQTAQELTRREEWLGI